MTVTIGENSVVTFTMTTDELLIISYALAEGVQKLADTASYLKHMKSEEYGNARDTAARAKAAQDKLVAATRSAVDRRVS